MAKSATPADLQIKPRDLHIDREAATPRWWFNGDPLRHGGDERAQPDLPRRRAVLHPVGQTLRQDAPPNLAADIRAFTVQEGAHTREHMAFNAITERAGYRTAEIEAYVTQRLGIARARPPLAQLAATMALEHFTAAFAHRLLADPDLLKGSPHDLARLWRWHSIEEIEHKGVAYDVFLHATRDMSPLQRWRLRRWAMLLTTLLFTKTVRETSLMLLKQDGIVGWRARFGLFRWLWFKPGLYRRMIGDYFAFYRPDFHPWQVDDRDLIAEAEMGLAQPA